MQKRAWMEHLCGAAGHLGKWKESKEEEVKAIALSLLEGLK